MSKYSFIAIFLTAIGITLIAPLFIIGVYADLFSQVGFSLLIVFTIYTLGKSTPSVALALALVIPFILLDALSIFNQSLFYLTAGQILICLFLFYAIFYIANRVLKEPIIDTNLVFGALIIYLLVGVLWSKFYWLTEVFMPLSFKGLVPVEGGEKSFERAFHDQFDLFYFSFTTMCTLGLGDITPLRNLAKSLTALQAIFGHIFLATVVAKLVSVWRRLPPKITELTGEKLSQALKKNQSLLIVFVLLITIGLITPSMVQGLYENLFLQTCFNLLIIFIVYNLSNERITIYLGVGLTAIIFALDCTSILTSSAPLLLFNQGVLCLFLVYATFYIAKRILKEPIIDTNLIFGAILIYVIVGILWSRFYWLTEMLTPDSFKGITYMKPPNLKEMLQVLFDLFYYSFTTVAGLGIGDISPTSHLGKSLTILESLFGQFFVATIIAKMVMVWRSEKEAASKDMHHKATATMVEKIKRLGNEQK